jgi:nucleotide-binding universal stress UspA family protein
MSVAILVAYDPRARDRAPVVFAVTLAELTGAQLIVASVQASAPVMGVFSGTALPFAVEPEDADLVSDCRPAIAELEPELREHQISFECRRIDGTSAARSLLQAAGAADVALLVVGTGRHQRLGSTAHRLLHGAPCPIAAVPHGWQRQPIGTVAAAVASADDARDTVAAGQALARAAHAPLRDITVIRVTPAMYTETEAGTNIRPARDIEDVEGEHKALTERALRRAFPDADDVSAFVGDPADVLIELSARFDVLVCGSRGYGPLRAVLLGSVSHKLVAEARCPVIVLPHGVRGGGLQRLTSGAVAGV